MSTYKVGYFVGSLSSTSINRILSRALIRVAPDGLEFTEIPIGNLPLYSPDYDGDFPPETRQCNGAYVPQWIGIATRGRSRPTAAAARAGSR